MGNMNNYVKKIESVVKKKISDIELISDCNNIVIKFNVNNNIYYAKFYQNKSIHVDNEIMLYTQLSEQGKKYLKNLIYSNFKNDEELKFAIFEEVKGKTLAELLEKNKVSNELADKIAKELLNYFAIVSKIKTNKYGNLNNSLNGKYDNFLQYLYEYQIPTTETLFLNKRTRNLSSLPYKLLEENADLLDEGYSCLTPIDTNFKNIMITDKGELKIIDPGAVISAPLSMGLGELVAHSYGTIIYDKLMDNMKATELQKKKLSIYATLSSLNIMAFLVRNKIGNIENSKPFGNNKTFFELIKGHLKIIRDNSKSKEKTETQAKEI